MKARSEVDEALRGEFCIEYPPTDCAGKPTVTQIGGEWTMQLVETGGGSGAIV